MLIIIHSETNKSNIEQNLGRPEYSYYFVLKEFRPVLERIGQVIEVSNPDELVDQLYFDCQSRGEDCVFLSFSPPHRTPIHYACPTIPVFAWEFSTIPTDTWHGEPRHDWRVVLKAAGAAITHSSFTVQAVRDAMGADYPVSAIPAPVWDRFANRGQAVGQSALAQRVTLNLRGVLLDSRTVDLRLYGPESIREDAPKRLHGPVGDCQLELDGVVYTSVFNPYDGRKNWPDMLSAFCTTFRDTSDATLVLKLTHHDIAGALNAMLHHLYKNQSFRCRVVLIHGFLADLDYERLVEATSFVVNSSVGEGQCLPLMEFMSCGKPAVAPCNTAMADYIDADNTFIVDSTEELTAWPHDPRGAYRTLRYMTNWDSLCSAFQASYDVAKHDQARYSRMASHAVSRLQGFCSQSATEQRLRTFLEKVIAQSKPAAVPAEEPEAAVSPRDCGFTDAVLDGWFLGASGELLKGFAIKAEDTLLDVGCGEGAATLFGMRQGASVIFTDSEQGKVRDLARLVEAQSQVPSLGLVSNSLPLPLADGCASKVVCLEVLEHVDEPERFMAELVRMGRPGAQYLISVPAPVGEHLLQGIAPASYYQAPNHIQIFSHERFAALVEDAGLIIEHRQASGFFWVMGMVFFWASERAAGKDMGGAVHDQIKAPYPRLMEGWARTWRDLLMQPDGLAIKRVLDQFMPKSQVIIARKPGPEDQA